MFKRLIFYWKADRLGPDMLSTHPLLFFKRTNNWICKKKFKNFGEGSEFRPYAYAVYPSNISIGKDVIIRPGTMMFADNTKPGYISIEDDVAIGSGVHFYVSNHIFDRTDIPIRLQGHYQSRPIKICKGAWIGAGSIILCGVTIGQNAVVGAGSVVTRDVEPYTVVVGNPAHKIKDIGMK